MQQTFLKFYVKMQANKDAFIGDEGGQDLIEYALVVAIIALAATAGMGTVAKQISNAFVTVGSKLGVAVPT
jgi:pilus assembly protein Flp/PilA